MLVTRETSHSPIGPFLALEQAPRGDTSRHPSTALLSSEYGESAVVERISVCYVLGLGTTIWGLTNAEDRAEERRQDADNEHCSPET